MSTPETSSERLDRIEAITERTAQNIEALGHKVDALSHQVGVMPEGLTELKMITSRTAQSVEQLAQTSARQERNIDRLVGIVETLISQPTR
jgi:methyl-accepting chemotaxis protein